MQLGAALTPDVRVHGVVVNEDSETSELSVVLLRWRDAVEIGEVLGLRPAILGYARAHPSKCGGFWTANWQPYMVTSSFAVPGWGPAVYDALFAQVHSRRGRAAWLMPDRRGVSPAARAVWRHYMLSRSDILTTGLPDSCRTLSPDPADPIFHYGYQLKRAPGPTAATLRRYGAHAVQAIAQALGEPARYVELRLDSLARAMFSDRVAGRP